MPASWQAGCCPKTSLSYITAFWQITPHKSLAPYRERRGWKSLAERNKSSGRGTFDRGDLKEVADFDALWSYYRFPFAMRTLQEELMALM